MHTLIFYAQNSFQFVTAHSMQSVKAKILILESVYFIDDQSVFPSRKLIFSLAFNWTSCGCMVWIAMLGQHLKFHEN